MLGDVADIRGRLRAVLPARWFADQTPTLDALLACFATPWAWLFSLLQYATSQCRIETASGWWLDLISSDFFGSILPRHDAEADSDYRIRIQWALVQEAATRCAISTNLLQLTGFPPRIFEPARASDTGAYASGTGGSLASYPGLAYGMAGGWGSLELPFQFFVLARRPVAQGVSLLAGYDMGFGGYGVGRMAYVDLAQLGDGADDQDIQQSLASVLPVTTVAWLQIS